MISICIPTYNRLPLLKECLKSIFDGFSKKDYPYEVIIADGGSTDGTLEYLRKLDNITLIEQGELTGAIKADNICFKVAKGDFLLPYADDFRVNADVIIKACKLMEKIGGQICGIAFLIELKDLAGRDKLKDYQIHSVLYF